jgi:hypothetical protein
VAEKILFFSYNGLGQSIIACISLEAPPPQYVKEREPYGSAFIKNAPGILA